MGEDDLFDIFPDMDLDGDHDLIDFLILDDIENEIQKEIEENSSHHINVNLDDLDDDDIYIEYGIDREDYATREDYLEAVEQAIRLANNDNIIEIKLSFSFGNESTDEFDYDKRLDELDGIEFRRAYAEYKLNSADPEFDTVKEIERYKFIINGSILASRYLTVAGQFLYAQAIKDHYKLPFSIPDEKDGVETHFETLLQDLIENNPHQAMEIWDWCLDQFMPYIQYAEYKNDLTHAILLDTSNFIDDFTNHIVSYMNRKPLFVEKLILKCTDSVWCVGELVSLALLSGHTDTAQSIIKCAFSNTNTDVHDKIRFIEDCIDECSNWNEFETMDTFQNNIFPIVFTECDVRIKNKIQRWQTKMREYIECMKGQ